MKNYFISIITGFLSLVIFSACTTRSGKVEKKDTPEGSSEIGWISMFDGKTFGQWDITSFGTEGPVHISEEQIVLGMGDGCTGITWKGDFPITDYEIHLQAKKISGNDFFCGLTFPVDSSFCSFIAGGWGGPVVGLSTIDGKDASENETRILKNFEHDKWYAIHLQVTNGYINAWIDEENVVSFNSRGRILSTRPEVNLSKPLGICAWTTTAALRDIKVKYLHATAGE